ncbi:MAG: hypothetical protein DWH91_10235 [Planctomycetota bacterium]|nr:MAG: hypothetical protein DWH91_10235 [Planctomycetota bacterium]
MPPLLVSRCTTATFPQRDPRIPTVICDDPRLTSESLARHPAIGGWDQQTPTWLAPDPEAWPLAVQILNRPPDSMGVVLWPASLSNRETLQESMLTIGLQLQRIPLEGLTPEIPLEYLPSLGPGHQAAPSIAQAISRVTGHSARMTTLLRAGLLLRHDFLDECHSLVQTREGDSDADRWHALMHRREPDASNAKYWFRRVGSHPIDRSLNEWAAPLLRSIGQPVIGEWDPLRFVDLCERVREHPSPENDIARRIQSKEMELLLKHCAAES